MLLLFLLAFVCVSEAKFENCTFLELQQLEICEPMIRETEEKHQRNPLTFSQVAPEDVFEDMAKSCNAAVDCLVENSCDEVIALIPKIILDCYGMSLMTGYLQSCQEKLRVHPLSNEQLRCAEQSAIFKSIGSNWMMDQMYGLSAAEKESLNCRMFEKDNCLVDVAREICGVNEAIALRNGWDFLKKSFNCPHVSKYYY